MQKLIKILEILGLLPYYVARASELHGLSPQNRKPIAYFKLDKKLKVFTFTHLPTNTTLGPYQERHLKKAVEAILSRFYHYPSHPSHLPKKTACTYRHGVSTLGLCVGPPHTNSYIAGYKKHVRGFPNYDQPMIVLIANSVPENGLDCFACDTVDYLGTYSESDTERFGMEIARHFLDKGYMQKLRK